QIDIEGLERELGVAIVPVNPRKNKGLPQLKKALELTAENLDKKPARNFIDTKILAGQAIDDVKDIVADISDYRAIHYLINHESFLLDNNTQDRIEKAEQDNKFNPTKTKAEEIMQRYSKIRSIMQRTVIEEYPFKE